MYGKNLLVPRYYKWDYAHKPLIINVVLYILYTWTEVGAVIATENMEVKQRRVEMVRLNLINEITWENETGDTKFVVLEMAYG